MNKNLLKNGTNSAISGRNSSSKLTWTIVAIIILSFIAIITPTQILEIMGAMAAAFMMVLGAVVLALKSIAKFEARQAERIAAK